MTGKSRVLVVGGTAGTGKTTIGETLAKRLGAPFLEGDHLHPESNVKKMSSGIPLTDDDRWGWLAEISHQSADLALQSTNTSKTSVVSCSSLKKSYRDYIRAEAPDTEFFFFILYADKDELVRRTESRKGHFMKSSMLDSQFAILQLPNSADEPTGFVVQTTSKSVDEIVDDILGLLDCSRQ